MPSVKELVGANSLQSPLTQLRVGVESRRDDAVSVSVSVCMHVSDIGHGGTKSFASGETKLILDAAVIDTTHTFNTVRFVRFFLYLEIDSTARPAHRLQPVQKQFCLLGRLGLVT